MMTARVPNRCWTAVICGLVLLGQSPAAHALEWEGKIQQYVKELEGGNSKARARALRQLSELPLKISGKYIQKSLEDPDFKVQQEAAQLVVEKKLLAARPRIQQWLSHWDERLRKLGAETLGEIGDTRSVFALVRVLSDPESKVRLAVILALGKLHTTDRREVIPLLGRLGDQGPAVRKAAVEVLAKKKDRRVVIPLISCWRDSSREVRQAVATALGEVGDQGAGPTLVRMSRDYSEKVALAAIASLGKLRYLSATELLIDLFHSGRSKTRDQAAQALATLRSDRANKALVQALRKVSLRPAAQRALATIGEAAAPHLNLLLQDPRTPRSTALAAVETARLARIKATTPFIVEQLRLGRLTRSVLIEALGHIGDRRAQRPLLELLESPSRDIRSAALYALARIVDERAGEPLLRLLNDSDRNIQLRTVRLLGRLRARIATPRLRKLATGKDRTLARAATGTLARIRDPRSVPTLMALLSHRDRQLRRLAGQALAGLRKRSTIKPILGLCRSARGALRVSCIQALGGVARDHSHKATLAYLTRIVGGVDRSASFAALDALAAMRDPEIPRLLMGRYHQLDLKQRRRILEVLGSGRSSHETLAAFMLRLMEVPQPSLRAAAAWSLGRVPGTARRRAWRALQKASKDHHWSVRVNATASLARLQHPRSSSTLRALCGSRNPHVRANALLGLAWLARRDAANAGETRKMLVRRLASDLNPWVRLNALRGLLALGITRVELSAQVVFKSTKKLLEHLAQKDPDRRVRLVVKDLLDPGLREAGQDWIGLFLLDLEKKPMRNAPFLLVIPSGLVMAATSDPLGEYWMEGIPQGRCFVEAPHFAATNTPH